MGVHYQAPVVEENLRVIIFSHGFSAHKNAYTFLTKELASQGYVIFCPTHTEPIRLEGYSLLKEADEKLKFVKEHRGKNLEKRYEQVAHLLMEISDKKYMDEIFQSSGGGFELNYKNTILAGHSFGAATALYTAIRTNYLNIRGVIGHDPWLFPMDNKYLSTKITIPILFLNSHTFDENVQEYQIRKRNLKLFRANQGSHDKLIGYIRFSDHISCSDVPFFIPRESGLLKMVEFPHLVEQNALLFREMTKIFLQKVIFSLDKPNPLTLEEVQEGLGDYCEKMYGLRDFFADEMSYFGDSVDEEIDY